VVLIKAVKELTDFYWFANVQDRLYRELQRVSGDEDVTEDLLPKLPYLSAVFQETLRKHPPVPILPLRYVQEDVELGGFHVPAGSQVSYKP